MSGAQIGTVVGGVIGAYFGGAYGAQIGMAIGGFIGGQIDPTKIYGPHIGDGQQQSATDGNPIAWVQGTARVAGTIVAVSPRREVKKKDDGKGSGTEQITYEAHQDFAILICESSELRGTVADGIVRVEQDGKIVYDSDPTSPIWQDSFEFMQGVDFMFGAEDQLPHPTLEAIYGVGNTLAYRGYLVAVFKDFNLTAVGDRIPQFVFTVKASNLNAATVVRYTDVFKYLQADTPDPGPFPPYSPGFDDSLWLAGRGGFGSGLPGYTVNTPPTDPVHDGMTFWLRKPYLASIGTPTQVDVGVDDFCDLWWNGEYMGLRGQTGSFGYAIDPSKVLKKNMAVIRGYTTVGENVFIGMSIYPTGSPPPPVGETITLADVVSAICLRGGLTFDDFDVTELVSTVVLGYPIAVQSAATDCLSPLLAGYFCYASEYDGQIHFRFLGQDAAITINPVDLIEADVGPDGAGVISNQRNQETEYPRKVTTSYYDPDQNYQAVTVTYERSSKDVNAIGEQAFQIPVVMSADDAMAATVKALKATWAALEGTAEYSLPIVGRGGESYLSIAAGDPIFFNGKRWVAEKVTLGHNVLKLETTYNRQSAYKTTIQAIPAKPPIPPTTRVGGPTTLYAMNLPSLRPQDTYGLYLAVSGETQAWNGAVVQISFDDGETWQNGLTATEGSVMGVLTTSPSASATTVGVDVNGDLETITSGQLAAQGNPFAILSPTDVAEIGQFRVATQTGEGRYTLSEVVRGQRGTTAAAHTAGDRFTMLDSVYFLPIDLSFGGTEVKLRAVTLGGKAEDAEIVTIVYQPDDQVILDGGGAPL